ncbi:hypothetical protein UA12_05610 [Burkholderia multivorans]|nr:hypothetical protein UA12_05610 [Burkholderia multivorans]
MSNRNNDDGIIPLVIILVGGGIAYAGMAIFHALRIGHEHRGIGSWDDSSALRS